MGKHLVQRRRQLHRVAWCCFLAIIVTGGISLLAAQATPINDASVLAHLNLAIGWYRQVIAVDPGAGQPSDLLYLSNARADAEQAIQAAFQSAQAIATLEAQQKKERTGQTTSASREGALDEQNLARALQDATEHLTLDRARLADLEKQVATAHGKNRQALIAQREALEAQIELDKTLQDALQKASSSAAPADAAQSGLSVQIAQLKQSVPEIFSETTKETSKSSNTESVKASHAQSSGLIGQASYLLSQTHNIHEIETLLSQTAQLRASADQLQKPLREQLRALVQQGRNAVTQGDASDVSQAGDVRQNMQQLIAHFKQVENAALPLRREMTVLDQVHGNLEEWRNSVLREYGVVLRSLLTRVFAILLALALVAGGSALWRSATLRYVHDIRRRRQLLLVLRFVSGFLMMLIVLLGLVSEFSSLATMAGFITAGIAVALQTVILSIAAYFTLIGRRGVRAGDRITVAGVTGDVLEIGLVRLHLMELGGTGIDLYPTGRVVVFSNAVLFGATPLFKQVPGTSYTWHELALALSPETDPSFAQLVLTNAANTVYNRYRSVIEHQHAVLERLMDTGMPQPQPRTKWQFSDDGLELVLRYPVDIRRAEEIDDQMTREIMRVISTNTQLKSVLSGTPKLRAAIRA
jgi:small-conductance mechanosensitive channel